MKYIAYLFASIMTFSAAKTFANDACDIWMCLPAGFATSYCSGAKSEFKHRIKHGHSPLPDFSSCIVDDGMNESDDMDYEYSHSAIIGAWRECSEWVHVGGKNGSRKCVAWLEHPEHEVVGATCTVRVIDHKRVSYPKHCTKTIKWIQYYQDGKKFQDRFIVDV